MPVKKKAPRKKATTKRKPVARKAAAKKTTAKRKPVARKATAKKTAAKRKPAARKATAKRKPVARKAATKRKPAAKKAKTKRKPNAAFMKPMQPSAKLSVVVGSKPLPRTEVTKKLWIYIKKNGLQDKVKRIMINADANLKAVFGGKAKVSMFEMTKLVSKHLSDPK